MKKQFGINYDDLQVTNHDSEQQLYIFLGWSDWLTLSIGVFFLLPELQWCYVKYNVMIRDISSKNSS